MADRAVIGYVHGGTVRQEFAESLLNAVRYSPLPVEDVISSASGPNISRARNRVVSAFLEDYSARWLLMCDTDMWFAADTVARLAAPGQPVTGALCFGQHPGEPAAVMMYSRRDYPGGTVLFVPWPRWPEDELVAVDATAAACLLIRRDALEAAAASAGDAAAPWFRESQAGASWLSEDLTFCMRCQAAGIPVHVHTGVQAGHMKTRMITEGNRL